MSKFTTIRPGAVAKIPTQKGDIFALSNDSVGTAQLQDESVTLDKLILSDIVVGSIQQVTSGAAHYSSLQAAHDAAQTTQKIVLLSGTYTENISWTKSDLVLEGKGRTSLINGTLTVSGSANVVKCLKVANSVTFSGDGNFFAETWIGSTGTWIDTGAGNQNFFIQET